MTKRLSKELFDEIYSKVPRLCVEVLINTEEGFILSKRLIPPCINMWHIPGGTVYFGEKLYEAAHRIADNELGVKINILGIIGIANYLEIYEGIGHAIGTIFLCELDGNKKFRGSYQGEEINVFDVDNIPDNTIPEHKKFLEMAKYRGYRGIYHMFEYIEG